MTIAPAIALLAVLPVIALAVMLGRMPVDRAEVMAEWWPMVPQVARFSFVGDPLVWSVGSDTTEVQWCEPTGLTSWTLEFEIPVDPKVSVADLSRWADDGGLVT